MKKDFAVICAANISKRNSGMHSVDLAAKQYFDKLGRSYDLIVTQGDRKVGKLRFEKIRDPKDFRNYRNIVYWGDFQNNPLWGTRDYCNKEITHEGVIDREEALNNWTNRYLLLQEQLDGDASVYAIGGCFMGAKEYLSNPAINQAFRDFVLRSRRIVVRDSSSYQFLVGISHMEQIKLGFDCASLLNLPVWPKSNHFVYSFKRTIGEKEGRRLAKAVEKATRISGVEINWLGKKSPFNSLRGGFMRNSRLISQAQFAITDIYHFSINSFGRGTPALCLGTSEGDFGSTIDDHKKFVLFDMLDSKSLMFDCGRKGLSMETTEKICDTASQLNSSEIGRVALQEFQSLKDRFKGELDECFS